MSIFIVMYYFYQPNNGSICSDAVINNHQYLNKVKFKKY